MGENLPISDFSVATPPENAAEQQEIVILPCTTTPLTFLIGNIKAWICHQSIVSLHLLHPLHLHLLHPLHFHAPLAPCPRIKLNLTNIASISSANTPKPSSIPSKSLTLISTLTPCPEIELLLGPLQLIVGQIRPFKHAIKAQLAKEQEEDKEDKDKEDKDKEDKDKEDKDKEDKDKEDKDKEDKDKEDKDKEDKELEENKDKWH